MIKNGVNEKSKYNQIANYTYLDTQVNKAVRDDSPNIYFSKVFEQCETGIAVYGNITDKALLLRISSRTVSLKLYYKWNIQIMKNFLQRDVS